MRYNVWMEPNSSQTPPISGSAIPNNAERFRNVPNTAESFGSIPKDSAPFRTVPNTSESFGNLRNTSARKEGHTVTTREAARLFEAAGVARTERSIVNWCQANRTGIARLDAYYDPNERKYFITQESVQ